MVVDASVALKWFVEEPNSAVAKDVLLSERSLSAPTHMVGEVGRGLLRRRRAGDMSPAEAKTALAVLPTIVSLELMDALGPLAFEIADRGSVTIYDALYVALAEQGDDVLITADRRLCDGLARTPWAGRARHLADRTLRRSSEEA